MAKASIKVKGFSVYSLLNAKRDQQGFQGVMIRVQKREKTGEKVEKGVKKYQYEYTSIDLEVYDPKGQRVKSKADDFKEGKFISGYDNGVIEACNLLIDSLKVKLANYIAKNAHFNKDLLIRELYDVELINNHKRKRTKYITIPVTHKGKVVDSFELEQKDLNQLIDPYFSKQTFINSDGTEKTIEGHFDSETGESLIESEEDFFELVTNAKVTADNAEEIKNLLERKKTISPAQVYKEGIYNKNDIFEVIGRYKFLDKKFAGDWIVIRFFDYKERGLPSSNIKDFNYKWIYNLCDFLFQNGVSDFSSKNFNPFNYDRNRILNANIIEYTDPSFDKFLKWIRKLCKLLRDDNILAISEKEIQTLTPRTWGIKKIHHKTRKQDNLYKDEFDILFKAKLKDQGEFKAKELERSRDIFVLMTWFGGLRPVEYTKDNLHLSKDGKGNYYVNYFTSDKNSNEIDNPVLNYSYDILKKYNFKIPFFENVRPDVFIEHLRAICEQLNLNREFVRNLSYKGKLVREKRTLNENINRYFARKTFIQILRDEGISLDDIHAFTGHESGEMISAYYTNSLKWKIEKIEKIKCN